MAETRLLATDWKISICCLPISKTSRATELRSDPALELLLTSEALGLRLGRIAARSSTEAETLALDMMMRLEALPLQSLMDQVLEALYPETGQSKESESRVDNRVIRSRPSSVEDESLVESLSKIDYVPSNIVMAQERMKMVACQDNEACIKIVI